MDFRSEEKSGCVDIRQIAALLDRCLQLLPDFARCRTVEQRERDINQLLFRQAHSQQLTAQLEVKGILQGQPWLCLLYSDGVTDSGLKLTKPMSEWASKNSLQL